MPGHIRLDACQAREVRRAAIGRRFVTLGSVGRQQPLRRRGLDAARRQFRRHTVAPDLVEFVHRDQRLVVQARRNTEAVQHPAQQTAMIEPDHEVGEPEPLQHVADRGADLDLDNRRARPDGVDVALIELTKPAARRPIRPPHRLNLVALEEPRQLAAMLGDDARQRHRQVVAQRQVRFPGGLVLTTAQDLENQLRALVAVLPRERLDVLERRRFEGLEPIALIDVPDHANHVVPAPYIVGQKITHAARGARLVWHRNFGTFEPDTGGRIAVLVSGHYNGESFRVRKA